jgi:hypothetical protein
MTYLYQPTQPGVHFGYYVAGSFFYFFLLVFLFFGICAAWILVRHGKSRLVATVMAGIFLFIFFGLAAEGIHILSTIKTIS